MSETITRVMIFSDTHGCLKEIPYLKKIDEYDYFIYLGDGYEEVKNWAKKNNLNDKFIAVSGNCDYDPDLPRQRFFEIDSVKIFITHGDLYKVKDTYQKIFEKAKDIGADIAMFGHTHYADKQNIDGLYLFNPGSIMPRGRDYGSVGYLEIKNEKILNLEHLTF
ncbi:metallophosphoesterase [bacterium]|nr:MAG: metallophosphoesterase [bacterium]